MDLRGDRTERGKLVLEIRGALLAVGLMIHAPACVLFPLGGTKSAETQLNVFVLGSCFRLLGAELPNCQTMTPSSGFCSLQFYSAGIL